MIRRGNRLSVGKGWRQWFRYGIRGLFFLALFNSMTLVNGESNWDFSCAGGFSRLFWLTHSLPPPPHHRMHLPARNCFLLNTTHQLDAFLTLPSNRSFGESADPVVWKYLFSLVPIFWPYLHGCWSDRVLVINNGALTVDIGPPVGLMSCNIAPEKKTWIDVLSCVSCSPNCAIQNWDLVILHLHG